MYSLSPTCEDVRARQRLNRLARPIRRPCKRLEANRAVVVIVARAANATGEGYLAGQTIETCPLPFSAHFFVLGRVCSSCAGVLLMVDLTKIFVVGSNLETLGNEMQSSGDLPRDVLK